jgi:hypothetical protein
MVFGQAPFADGASDPAQFAGLAEVFQPVRAIEPWLTDAPGLSDIGLVMAPKPRTASKHWGTALDGAEAFHDAMIDCHLQYDIIQLDRDLSPYQLVILPDQAALSDAEMDSLRVYVRDGGALLASGCSSLWDENGRRRADFGLADVFGVEYQREAGADFVYLQLGAGELAADVTALPILIDEVALQVAPTNAQVLHEFTLPESRRTEATTILWGDAAPDESKRVPGILRNAFGAGSCTYLAAPLRTKGMPNVWVKRLMGALAANLVEQPILSTNAPAGVEVALNQQNGRMVIHLINRYCGSVDQPSFHDNGITLLNIEIKVDLTRSELAAVEQVYLAPATPLDYALADGCLSITLPELQLHAVVAIE